MWPLCFQIPGRMASRSGDETQWCSLLTDLQASGRSSPSRVRKPHEHRRRRKCRARASAARLHLWGDRAIVRTAGNGLTSSQKRPASQSRNVHARTSRLLRACLRPRTETREHACRRTGPVHVWAAAPSPLRSCRGECHSVVARPERFQAPPAGPSPTPPPRL